jgi:DNA integrity scanning protein DisA with diadenylate cyclase activity
MARTLAEVLSLFSAILAVMNFLVSMSFILEYGVFDIRWVFWEFALPLAVLLVAISVHFAMRFTREQLTALQPSLRASAEAAIKTEVIAAGTTLEDELKRYEEHLAKLEELRRSGQVSEEVYQTLKGEYTAKIEELRKKIRAFR